MLLLPGYEDEAIWRYFASLAFPAEELVRRTLDVLGGSDRPLSIPALEPQVELSWSRLDMLLTVLDVDGAVRRVTGGWISTGQTWSYDADRYARVAAARSAEQQAMRDYIATTDCRMQFLRRQLDDPEPAPCGRCDLNARMTESAGHGHVGLLARLVTVGAIPQPEVAATRSLCYLLEVPGLADAFTALIQSQADLPTSAIDGVAAWRCEHLFTRMESLSDQPAKSPERARVDLVGFDSEERPRVVIEAKFGLRSPTTRCARMPHGRTRRCPPPSKPECWRCWCQRYGLARPAGCSTSFWMPAGGVTACSRLC